MEMTLNYELDLSPVNEIVPMGVITTNTPHIQLKIILKLINILYDSFAKVVSGPGNYLF